NRLNSSKALTISSKAYFIVNKFFELWPLFVKLNLSRVPDAGPILAFDRQDLATFIIAARRANSMTGDGAPTLWAFAKLRPMPAVGRFSCAQPHLGCFAFRDSHGSGLEKQSL